jgi:hypothetical protein
MAMTIQGPSTLSDPTGLNGRPTPIVALPPTVAPPRSETGAVDKTPAATATVSPWGELLSKLQQLKHTKPETFEKTVNQLAETAAAAANKATGGDKPALAKVAEQLAQVAKTGELSVFKPPKHHHHAIHASGAAGTTTGLGSLMQKLLEQVDVVLGPAASSPLSP